MSVTITDFLLARIAEDEAEAADLVGWDTIDGIAFGDRLLAECGAKRKLIRMVAEWPENHEGWHKLPWYGVGNDILFALAAVYKDHEDYQQEWAL